MNIHHNSNMNQSAIIQSSKKSKRTFNPIRNIVDNLKPQLNHPYTLLNLALGINIIYFSFYESKSNIFSYYLIR